MRIWISSASMLFTSTENLIRWTVTLFKQVFDKFTSQWWEQNNAQVFSSPDFLRFSRSTRVSLLSNTLTFFFFVKSIEVFAFRTSTVFGSPVGQVNHTFLLWFTWPTGLPNTVLVRNANTSMRRLKSLKKKKTGCNLQSRTISGLAGGSSVDGRDRQGHNSEKQTTASS